MNQAPSSCVPVPKMSKARKIVEEAKESKNPELDLTDKALTSFLELPGLFNMNNITRLTLSHNRIKEIPPGLANLTNLEILNLCNNIIEELPTSLSSMPKLRILNLACWHPQWREVVSLSSQQNTDHFKVTDMRMPTAGKVGKKFGISGINRISKLPRGFGAFPVLEVLDLTYNNLKEDSFLGNFFMMETLRALYLGDNDLETFPPQVQQLKNLQILVLRENDLIEIPKEIGELSRLRELHIQGNRLTLLPPEIGNLDLVSNKAVFRMENNPWVTPIADQFQVGIPHVLEYIKTETYRYLYNRQTAAKPPPPPIYQDKSKKISRQR